MPLALFATAGLFIAVTGFTGFPGPPVVRRYPTTELTAAADLVDAIGAEQGGCWPLSAEVDAVRSRVEVHGGAVPDEVLAVYDDEMFVVPRFENICEAPMPGP